MKYVRTKDKIYEVIEENERYYKCCYNDESITLVSKVDNDAYGFSKALKESYSLDKLCDHLVIVEKGSSMLPALQHRFLGDLFLADSWNRRFQENKIEVYGAIWTKGEDGEPILKSVAKMNSEGGLELL